VPLWKVKRQNSYSDLLEYKAYWDYQDELEYNKKSKLDFYLAQIAREVHVVLLKNADAKKVSVNDFILKFKMPEEKKVERSAPVEEITEEEIKRRTQISQNHWFRLLKIKDKPNGTPHST